MATINKNDLLSAISKLTAEEKAVLLGGVPAARPQLQLDVEAARAENERLKAEAARKAAASAKVGTVIGIGVTESGKVEITLQGTDWKPQIHGAVVLQLLERSAQVAGFIAENVGSLAVPKGQDAAVVHADLKARAMKLAK